MKRLIVVTLLISVMAGAKPSSKFDCKKADLASLRGRPVEALRKLGEFGDEGRLDPASETHGYYEMNLCGRSVLFFSKREKGINLVVDATWNEAEKWKGAVFHFDPGTIECLLSGKFDPEIIAFVKQNSVKPFAALRANRKTGRFEKADPTKVVCEYNAP